MLVDRPLDCVAVCVFVSGIGSPKMAPDTVPAGFTQKTTRAEAEGGGCHALRRGAAAGLAVHVPAGHRQRRGIEAEAERMDPPVAGCLAVCLVLELVRCCCWWFQRTTQRAPTILGSPKK